MHRARLWTLLLAAAGAAALLAVWTAREVATQRREVETALRAQAELLAGALGPALASAAAAVRELDELLAWKLLDRARTFVRLEAAGALDGGASAPDSGELETVVRLSPGGGLRWRRGASAELAAELATRAAPMLAGGSTELVFPPAGELGAAAAARTADGGLVAVGAPPARTFADAGLGPEALLQSLVRTGAVLYLEYDEQPGLHAQASWDERPVAGGAGDTLRGRPVFEVMVPVEAPAGVRASLRVGLDGAPLQRAGGGAMRRTAVVGAVLAALGLLGTAYAEVQRARTREREENRRRFLELEEERRRSERLAAAGALAAGLAHEVRNPLNAISLAAQRLARLEGGGEEGRELAGRVRAEVRRLEATLKDFLDLGRPAGGERELHDLADLARDVLALLELEAAERRVRLVPRLEPTPARVDRESLRRALVNLVRNALQASPPGGEVEVTVGTQRSARTSGRLWVRLAVGDRGPGVAPGFAERAFDAFVTTKASGTGLGLALVRRVAEEHGGRASLHNRPGGGAEALLELPLEKERA